MWPSRKRYGRSVVSGGLAGVLLLVWLLLVTVVVVAQVDGDNGDYFKVSASLLNGHAIQLVINWEGHSELEVDGRKVDLTVKTSKVSRSCPSISCTVLAVFAEEGFMSLPEESQYMQEPRECDFHPGCSYTVIFKYEDDPMEIKRDITIPECVENLCRCDYEQKFPNYTIKLDYDEELEILHFHWEIDKRQNALDESELRNFVVRYFKVHNTKSISGTDTFEPHLVFLNESLSGDTDLWTGMADLPLSRVSFGIQSEDSVARIKLEIFLLDSKECSSYSSVEYLELSKRTESAVAGSHWIPTSLIIAAGVLSIPIGAVFVYHISKLGRHIIAKLFRLPYSNINDANNSMTRTSIPLQENIIYVEKELYEAKISGAVDSYEVSPTCLSIGEEIGKGAFGRVFIAFAHNADGRGNTVTVAVKKLKKRPTEEEAEEFFNEIKTMKRVGYHENIISLLGCCTIRQPVLMIMEYIGNGDLHRYLIVLREKMGYATINDCEKVYKESETKESDSGTETECESDSDASYILQNEKPLRPSVTETLYTTVSSTNSLCGGGGGGDNKRNEHVLDHYQELQQFAIQIANGMAHLEDLDITHRDLATRNILIDDQKRLKISDFGLSRDGVYVTTRMKKVPLRWLSIEAIRRSLYSSKSDVWAFGVVLWEIGTLGNFPYQGMDNHAILPFLLDGGRLMKPENCSDKLYDVMLRCWAENPLARPSFFELMGILQEPEQKIYIDLDELGDNDVFYEAPVTAGEATAGDPGGCDCEGSEVK